MERVPFLGCSFIQLCILSVYIFSMTRPNGEPREIYHIAKHGISSSPHTGPLNLWLDGGSVMLNSD